MILRQSPFVNRYHLADFLNTLGLCGKGVEVGTHRGVYAKQLLDRWAGSKLFCVDPWSVPEGYEEQVLSLAYSNGNRQDDYDYAIALLSEHATRCEFIRTKSEYAYVMFGNSTLDFVYIDGDHRYDEVYKDLSLWWPKVKVGGLLAGHDFLMHPPDKIDSVQRAVLDFVRNKNIGELYMIVEQEAMPWSFYIKKEK